MNLSLKHSKSYKPYLLFLDAVQTRVQTLLSHNRSCVTPFIFNTRLEKSMSRSVTWLAAVVDHLRSKNRTSSRGRRRAKHAVFFRVDENVTRAAYGRCSGIERRFLLLLSREGRTCSFTWPSPTVSSRQRPRFTSPSRTHQVPMEDTPGRLFVGDEIGRVSERGLRVWSLSPF